MTGRLLAVTPVVLLGAAATAYMGWRGYWPLVPLGVVGIAVDHDAQRRTWLTTLQFAQLLKFSRRNDRSHAMVVSMGMLGMRIAEMCSLDVTDVRRLIGAANVTFTGKGGRTFTLDLPLEVLTAYDNLTAGRDRRAAVPHPRRAR